MVFQRHTHISRFPRAENNARLVELVTYWDQKKMAVMRAGVMIANTGADKKEWRYLFNTPGFAIPSFLSAEKMQLTNLQVVRTVPHNGELYDLLAEKDQGQKTIYYLDKDYEKIRHLAEQRHIRPFSQGGGDENTSPYILIANALVSTNCGQKYADPCCQGFYCLGAGIFCSNSDGLCHNSPSGGTGGGTGPGPGSGGGPGNNQLLAGQVLAICRQINVVGLRL